MARRRIKTRGRLVEDQELRLGSQCGGHGHHAPLAARKGQHATATQGVQFQLVEKIVNPRADGVFGKAAIFQRKAIRSSTLRSQSWSSTFCETTPTVLNSSSFDMEEMGLPFSVTSPPKPAG